MKKSALLALPLVIGAACSSRPADSYVVKGDVAGIPDSTMMMLIPLSHLDQLAIDSALVVDGKFEFKGSVDEPRAVAMIAKDNYGRMEFMLENADIAITGEAEAEQGEDGKYTFNFDKLTVAGSPLTDKFIEIMAPRTKLNKRMIAHQAALALYWEQLNAAREAGNAAAVDSIQNSEGYKALMAEEEEIFNSFGAVLDKAVADNKDSFWGPLMMIAQTSYLNAENRETYQALSEEAKNSNYGKEVYSELYPVGQPGEKVPAFAGKDTDGNEVSLEGLAKDKKYVLIDFWASWCRPCRAEIPNVKAIYDKHKAAGFDVVSVSIDKDEAAWLDAVKKEDLKWTNIRDVDQKIADAYHVSAVPTMYIVDSEGKLVAENLRGEELAKKVDELMAK